MAMSDSLLRCAHEQARTVEGSSCGSTTRFVSAADVGSAAIMGAVGVGGLDGRIRRTRVDLSTGA